MFNAKKNVLRIKRPVSHLCSLTIVISTFLSSAAVHAERTQYKSNKKSNIPHYLKRATSISKVQSLIAIESDARISADQTLQASIDAITVNGGVKGDTGAIGPQGEQGISGIQGPAGPQGEAGLNGVNGLHCWDSNANQQGDPSEDVNNDGNYDAFDCQSSVEVSLLLKEIQFLKSRLANSDFDNDGYSPNEGDCNDSDAMINPAAYDEIGDGIDSDCDGLIDNVITVDNDNDGFDSVETGGLDCNDFDATINPDAEEIADGIDNNCDGIIENIVYLDKDGDGFNSLEMGGSDCNDLNALINPSAYEIADGIDNNCDGVIDNILATSSILIHNDTMDSPSEWLIDGVYPDFFEHELCDNRCVKIEGGDRTIISKYIDNALSGSIEVHLDSYFDDASAQAQAMLQVKLIGEPDFQTVMVSTGGERAFNASVLLPSKFDGQSFDLRIINSGAIHNYLYIDNVKIYVNTEME